MRLFTKYNRLTIGASIAIFVLGSCVFYVLLHFILIHQVDESLQTEQQEITTFVSMHHALPEVLSTKDQHTDIRPATQRQGTTYSTIKKQNGSNGEDMRAIQFGVAVNGQYYLVSVSQPLEDTEALLQVIIGVTVGMIALILLISYLINRTVINRLWQPFYNTIGSIKDYRVAGQNPMQLGAVPIDEFALLNESINAMTARVQADYESLKNFTGQAAHEMQTPLAIIRTKLDALMQNEAILKEHSTQVTGIEQAVNRLSKLFQSLLLLTKVENKQFALGEEVQLDRLIESKLPEMAEMAGIRGLEITAVLDPVAIKFHAHLTEILVANLLGNAMRYNKAGGRIEITLHEGALTVANTSYNSALDEGQVFKRFYKQSGIGEGTGLGLSIMKEICVLACYDIGYQYSTGLHTFTITF